RFGDGGLYWFRDNKAVTHWKGIKDSRAWEFMVLEWTYVMKGKGTMRGVDGYDIIKQKAWDFAGKPYIGQGCRFFRRDVRELIAFKRSINTLRHVVEADVPPEVILVVKELLAFEQSFHQKFDEIQASGLLDLPVPGTDLEAEAHRRVALIRAFYDPEEEGRLGESYWLPAEAAQNLRKGLTIDDAREEDGVGPAIAGSDDAASLVSFDPESDIEDGTYGRPPKRRKTLPAHRSYSGPPPDPTALRREMSRLTASRLHGRCEDVMRRSESLPSPPSPARAPLVDAPPARPSPNEPQVRSEDTIGEISPQGTVAPMPVAAPAIAPVAGPASAPTAAPAAQAPPVPPPVPRARTLSDSRCPRPLKKRILEETATAAISLIEQRRYAGEGAVTHAFWEPNGAIPTRESHIASPPMSRHASPPEEDCRAPGSQDSCSDGTAGKASGECGKSIASDLCISREYTFSDLINQTGFQLLPLPPIDTGHKYTCFRRPASSPSAASEDEAGSFLPRDRVGSYIRDRGDSIIVRVVPRAALSVDDF
ncbi:hypothetical protein BDK51DRAFT_27110, partial [Blyttiomyces helicus]